MISPSAFSGVLELSCLAPVPGVVGSPMGAECVIASPGLPSTMSLISSCSAIVTPLLNPHARAGVPVAAFSVSVGTNVNGGRPRIRHLFQSHSESFLLPHSLNIQFDLHLVSDDRIAAL